MLKGGNVNEHMDENFSAIAGLVNWWITRYLKTSPEDPTYYGLDEFIDKEANREPVFAGFRAVLEQTCLTKAIHDSGRQCMLSNVRLLLEQLAELCAAVNAKIYLRYDPICFYSWVWFSTFAAVLNTTLLLNRMCVCNVQADYRVQNPD